MKTFALMGLVAGIAVTPLAIADARLEDAKRAVALGTDYGIVSFESLEFDDDRHEEVEIEGWLEDGWHVELEINSNGEIEREKRSRYDREPYGISASDLVRYIEAASAEGMEWFEDIEISARGYVSIEGDDQRNDGLDIDFRVGSFEPVRIDRDD